MRFYSFSKRVFLFFEEGVFVFRRGCFCSSEEGVFFFLKMF